MVFNEYAKNYDDHTKNIAFLMNKRGEWSLSPAFDVTFSYRKESIWVNSHQMLINGKTDEIKKEDFIAIANNIGLKHSEAEECIEEVANSVMQWEKFANEAELSKVNTKNIKTFLEFN